MSHSIRRLSRLVKGLNAKSYLEIGVCAGDTFNSLCVEAKDAVDPHFLFDTGPHETPHTRFFEMTSDDFFRAGHGRQKYDLIFLDGLHTFEQTFRDLCASFAVAHDRTVWLIDDVLPVDVFSAHPDQAAANRFRQLAGIDRNAWHGDVYKVVFALHDFFPNLSYRTTRTGGNCQTLLWREPRFDFKPVFNNLELISRLTYFDLQNHLDVYNFENEDDALTYVLARINLLSGTNVL